MRIATWNVNGVRARWDELTGWLASDGPDIVCLQEIKATALQIPEPLTGLPDYQSYWHGAPGGYSGVSLHVRRSSGLPVPRFFVPELDFETRIVCAELGALTVASIYVPNGHKDHAAKLRFLADLTELARGLADPAVLCGDLNVTREDRDVHRSQRKPGAIGQRPDERAALAALLDTGYVDLLRAGAPDDDALFTWWPPWRDQRQRNRGWRIDYLLATSELARRAVDCRVLAELGSSDHAPVVARFD
jgi:exodeoxyribonuclease-3